MIRGLIFDLGYTLLDFKGQADLPGVRRRMAADLARYLQGYTTLVINTDLFTAEFCEQLATADRMRHRDFHEYTARYVLERTFAQLNLELPDAHIMKEALAAFFAYSETLWVPMPNLHKVLLQLEQTGHSMALISNASDEANVQRQIDEHGLRHYFHPIVVSAAIGIRKPHPLIFKPVLDEWDIPAHQIVMIGDTLGADILGATNVSMRSIWISTQADRPDNLAKVGLLKPDATSNTLEEIPSVLSALNSVS